MAKIENLQFEDLCRLCATKIAMVSAVNIFETEGTIGQINECLPIKVRQTDMWPKKICKSCLIKLDLFCDFRERAAESEKLFVDLYKEFTIARQNDDIENFIVPMDHQNGLVVVKQHQILNEDSFALTLLGQDEDMIIKQEIIVTCDNVNISPHLLDLNNQDVPDQCFQTSESIMVDSNPNSTQDSLLTVDTINFVPQVQISEPRYQRDLSNIETAEVNLENDIQIITNRQCDADQPSQNGNFDLKIESEEIKLEDDLVNSPLNNIQVSQIAILKEKEGSREHSLLPGEQFNSVSVSHDTHVYKCAKCSEVFTNLDVLDSHSNEVLGTCAKATPIMARLDENVTVDKTKKDSLENSAKSKEIEKKVKQNRKKDFCFFCKNYVFNFSRHMRRHHLKEKEVQNIFSFSPQSRMRKKLLGQLRKKGNFLNPAIPKLVRRQGTNVNILPCTNCLGYFSAKRLWRHRTVCMGKSDGLHQVKAQNFLLKDLPIDKQLKDKVFLRMRPDEISMTAKSDELICAFGARYLNKNPKKQFVNVTSSKMRELARLLIEMQKLDPSIKKLFEALRSDRFRILMAATKVVAQYNEQNGSFKSVSTALNLGTAIKQCCQIAILDKTQVHATLTAEETEADLNKLIELIDTEWLFEIAAKASNDLCKKKNKITMISLACNLKLLREYLISTINSAVNQLQIDNEDKDSYITLLETIFCRVLLFNRRRPDELQRLLLRMYEKSEDPALEEYSEMLAPLERIMFQKLKRVVTHDKRNRRVLIFFNSDLQEHINILLRYRGSFVSKNNIYLFGHPSNVQPICGYKTIQKYAKLSGAKNPQAFATTKLRKHVSTLTQVSSMSENDIEKLLTYIGYLDPFDLDDTSKTAKKCKLILLMEKRETTDRKRVNLDEIDVDLYADLENDDINEALIKSSFVNSLSEAVFTESLPGTSRDLTDTVPKLECKVPSSVLHLGHNIVDKKKRILVPWTNQQKKVVLEFFAKHIEKKKLPKKRECVVLKNQYATLLHNKDWLKIKVFVQNEYVKRSR